MNEIIATAKLNDVNPQATGSPRCSASTAFRSIPRAPNSYPRPGGTVTAQVDKREPRLEKI